MNMFKKNGGFTLVELIVVIAILAILAGVAVPAYSGYINKANEAADTTALSAVKTAAQGAMAIYGEVTGIEFIDGANNTGDTVKVTYIPTGKTADDAEIITITTENEKGASDFATFLGGEIDLKTGNKATWVKGQNENKWKIETAS